MIRIAICDDVKEELKRTKYLLDMYSLEHDLQFTIDTFSKPVDLVHALKNSLYDIYFLDIIMKPINGIELGKIIRKRDELSQIVYVSSDPGFALESFDVHPLHYLIKPIKSNKFYDTMNRALNNVKMKQNDLIMVKTKEGYNTFNMSRIQCVEFKERRAFYYLSNYEVVETLTLQESFNKHVQGLLNKNNFVHPHVSYVINFDCVEVFAKKTFTLKVGKVVPVARTQYTQVRSAYLDYLLETGNASRL